MAKLSLYLATLLLGTNFSASTLPTNAPTAISARMTATEQIFVDLANAERWDRNLGVLSINPLLTQVAREHSREMCEKNYFDHISPTPELKTPMSRYMHGLGRTPTWAYLGENLFYCTIVDARRGHKCLMESPTHRANIIDRQFEQIGVGAYVSPNGEFWVTEIFLAQRD